MDGSRSPTGRASGSNSTTPSWSDTAFPEHEGAVLVGFRQEPLPRPHARSAGLWVGGVATQSQADHASFCVNEGFTEYFADRVQEEHAVQGSTRHAYGPQLHCANIVRRWIHNDDNLLARAYFQGDANPLLQVIRQKLGMPTAMTFIEWVNDREGLRLCDEIEAKGP